MWACFWNHFRTPLKNGSDHFFSDFWGPKMGPKGWAYFGAGGSWGTLGAKVRFWTWKLHLKASKSDPKEWQSTQKGNQSSRKLARRTARSGLNNLVYHTNIHYKRAYGTWPDLPTFVPPAPQTSNSYKCIGFCRRIHFFESCFTLKTAKPCRQNMTGLNFQKAVLFSFSSP